MNSIITIEASRRGLDPDDFLRGLAERPAAPDPCGRPVEWCMREADRHRQLAQSYLDASDLWAVYHAGASVGYLYRARLHGAGAGGVAAQWLLLMASELQGGTPVGLEALHLAARGGRAQLNAMVAALETGARALGARRHLDEGARKRGEPRR